MNGALYRRLTINGLDNIDPQKTYLVTSNHPNGFTEPLIMATHFPVDLNFLVRGDMFENPFMNWFLRSTHQIPIFRFVDGYSKMKENSNSLSEVTKKVSEGNTILIFAEGSTLAAYKCRPIQKGTAKIAFMTFEEYPDTEIEILPVGINMSSFTDAGGEVILNIGKPFSAKPYFENFDQKVIGIKTLTKDIKNGMTPLILNIDDEADEIYLVKFWELLSLLDKDEKRITTDKLKYERLRNCSKKICEGDTFVTSEIDRLYQEAFDANGHKRLMGVKRIPKLLHLILGLPGYIFYFLPIKMGIGMRDGKVKRKAFKGPVLAVTAFIVSLIIHLMSFVIIGLVFSWFAAIATTIFIMLSGHSYLIYWEGRHKVRSGKLSSQFFKDVENLIAAL